MWGGVAIGVVVLALLALALDVPYLGSFVDWLINRVPPLSYLIVQYAVPIAFGALCGLMCERSGVVNIGIEGMILTSAFVAFLTGAYLHSVVGAPAAAIIAHRRRDHRGDAALDAACLAVDHDQGRPDHQRHGHQHPGAGRNGVLQPAPGLHDRPVRDEYAAHSSTCPTRSRRSRSSARSSTPCSTRARSR